MNPETSNQQPASTVAKTKFFNQVTPFSKYVAMVLFIILPFIGGWIGYQYAPEKIIEIENIIVKEVPIQNTTATDSPTVLESEDLKDWQTYTSEYAGWSIKYPQNWRFQETSPLVPGNVGFGPNEIKQDVAMGVNVYETSETNISDLIDSQISPLAVSNYKIEPAILNGMGAVKVSLDTGGICFYFQETDSIYQLCGWNKSDEEFNLQVEELTGEKSNVSFRDFYNSFKIND